ncbi:MAG: DUF3046 domain-containing protein [Nocardioidaceae bacterium]
MRYTEFWARMEEALGSGYARSWADQQVLRGLEGRTVLEAIEAGDPLRLVWRAVSAELDLPAAQR